MAVVKQSKLWRPFLVPLLSAPSRILSFIWDESSNNLYLLGGPVEVMKIVNTLPFTEAELTHGNSLALLPGTFLQLLGLIK